jgi:hypothetical protein
MSELPLTENRWSSPSGQGTLAPTPLPTTLRNPTCPGPVALSLAPQRPNQVDSGGWYTRVSGVADLEVAAAVVLRRHDHRRGDADNNPNPARRNSRVAMYDRALRTARATASGYPS